MATENTELMKSARQSLTGKWELAVVTFLVYIIITGVAGSLPKIGSIVSLLISGPFLLGAAIFSLSVVRDEAPSLEQIFQGFRHYGKALATYLLMVLLIVLWALLLIIPGIIAALSYSMTFYILADNPSLQPMEALNKSKEMMNGYKWKLFYLGLRFLLLALLCLLTLGIGFLWLIPYINVTTAKFYEDVKASSGPVL